MTDSELARAILQLNNVRQILALVKERPCINKGGTTAQRGTVIAYAELTTVEKMLNDVVQALIPTPPRPSTGNDFPRPMGATPKEK